MKKIIIAIMIIALAACALVSCTTEQNDESVGQSSSSQETESSVSDGESSIVEGSDGESSIVDSSVDESSLEESANPDESSDAVSEPVEESDVSEESAKEEVKISISVDYADDDLLSDTNSYVMYESGEEAYSFVAFKLDAKVTNLRFFSVIATDTDSTDGALKIEEVLFPLDELTPDTYFVTDNMVFGDVYPMRGISFVDENGNTQYFCFMDSAYDGSMSAYKSKVSE